MKNTLSIYCLSALIISFLFINLALLNAQPAKWTFMVYLDGDNNLEEDGISDFNEMEAVDSTDSINIVVQFDRIGGYATIDGNWTDTRRFRVEHDDNLNAISTEPLEVMGELNMGDPEVLADFIEWSAMNYPAEHYAIVLWNHGGGMWKKDDTGKQVHPDKDVCYDESDGDYLTNYEVGDAIRNSGIHFDIVAYDACLMGMIEVAYQIRDLADIMVASEETIPLAGYDYTGFLQELAADPNMPSSLLSEYMVDSYGASYPFDAVTLSAIDLHLIRDVAAKNDTLAKRIIENDVSWSEIGAAWNETQYFYDWSYRDLWSYANLVNNYVDDAAIKSAATDLMVSIENAVFDYYASSNYNSARGLSIYFPDLSNYNFAYEDPLAGRDFADSTGWVNFLHIYHEESYIPPDTCACLNLSILTNPSGTFEDGSGDKNYGNNCECAWLIQPSHAASITVTVNSLNLEYDCDFLYIYDGNTNNASMLGEFTGTATNHSVTSTGGAIYIEFTTDYSVTEDGWEITYTTTGLGDDPIQSILDDWRIYPNPGNGTMHCERLQPGSCGTLIEVYDAMGQVVLSKEVPGKEDRLLIDISDKPEGVYYIKISGQNGSIINKYILN